MDDNEIRDERARAERYIVDKLNIVYTHCPMCGSRMTDGKCWYGCGNPAVLQMQQETNAAIIAVYDKPGNFVAEAIDSATLAMYDEDLAACKR